MAWRILSLHAGPSLPEESPLTLLHLRNSTSRTDETVKGQSPDQVAQVKVSKKVVAIFIGDCGHLQH